MRPWFLWFCAALVSGCGSCSDDAAVEGPHPYVRCALDEPEPGTWQHGPLTAEREGRTLTLRGELTLTVFSAGFGSAGSSHLAAYGTLPDGPVLVLGGYAHDEASAERFAQLMGDRLVLLLPGGSDQAEHLDAALTDNAIDLRGVHRIVLDHGEFAVVPGADGGRYAARDGGCGFGEPDLAAVRETFGDEPVDRRWLLAWSAPRAADGAGPDLGFEGAHVGSESLSALAASLGAAGGVFAFPRTQVARPTADLGTREVPPGEPAPDLALVAPLLGQVVERADESRHDGRAIRLSFSSAGLSWSEVD